MAFIMGWAPRMAITRQIVGERGGSSVRTFSRVLVLKVGGHPGLEGAEQVFDGRAADTHALGRPCQAKRQVPPRRRHALQAEDRSGGVSGPLGDIASYLGASSSSPTLARMLFCSQIRRRQPMQPGRLLLGTTYADGPGRAPADLPFWPASRPRSKFTSVIGSHVGPIDFLKVRSIIRRHARHV
jgi:hypothetical protein